MASATVLSAAGVQAAVSAGGTAQAAPTWTGGPVFNDPLGTESALPGSTIRVAVHHLWESSVVNALVAAETAV